MIKRSLKSIEKNQNSNNNGKNKKTNDVSKPSMLEVNQVKKINQ